MSQIETVHAREILDSRGNPTVEVEVALRSRRARPRGRAVGRVDRRVRGRRAARRRRRAGCGKGVTQAVANVNGEIAEARARAATRSTRPAIDRALIELDGTPNKARLGANAILGVSLGGRGGRGGGAACRSGATSAARRAHVLPVPMMNVLNGGAHADNSVDFQEFMIVPVGAPSVRGGAAHGRRGVPRAQEDARRARARDRRRRRGRLRARPRVERGGARAADRRRSRRPATSPASDVAIALDPATSEIYRGRRLRARARGPHADAATSWSTTGPTLARALPDRLDRGRHGRGRLGRLEAR